MSWYRKSDWTRHTAVLAAVVAAASLAFTAWGTYKAAQVADDQLAQSREDSEKDERAQASRISWWEDEDPYYLVIENRSLDPAWGYVDFDNGGGPGEATKDRGAHSLALGVLPPCTRREIPGTAVTDQIRKEQHADSYTLIDIAFTDADGKQWLRYPAGELAPETAPNLRGNFTGWLGPKGVKTTTLEDCSMRH